MDASDALADQPEPAGTVAEAAIGSCGKYEVAFEEASRRSGGLPYEGFERIKKDTVVPKVLARVMGIRAARAKLRMESPGTKPAIDYRPHVGGEMPLLRIAALCAAALGMAGCVNYGDLTGSRKTEQHLAAACSRWNAMSANAAHPNAATIARHDKLMQQAADLEKAAVNLQGPAREAAIRNIAQAHIEAAAEYDAPGKRRIADQCWGNLGMVRQEHRQMEQELMQAATKSAAEGLQATGDAMMNRPRPTLSAPPSPPTGPGLSGLSDFYTVRHGDIRLISPDGPVIGHTSRIGPSAPPTVVVVPVPVRMP